MAAFVIFKITGKNHRSTQAILGVLMFILGISVIQEAATFLAVYRYIPDNLLLLRNVIRSTRTIVVWIFNVQFLGLLGSNKGINGRKESVRG